MCKRRARPGHTVSGGLNKNQKVEILFAAKPMGNFVFPLVVDKLH